jgi:hypothetical protein
MACYKVLTLLVVFRPYIWYLLTTLAKLALLKRIRSLERGSLNLQKAEKR